MFDTQGGNKQRGSILHCTGMFHHSEEFGYGRLHIDVRHPLFDLCDSSLQPLLNILQVVYLLRLDLYALHGLHLPTLLRLQLFLHIL
jgi:hypothetical protein